jgi:hypothetical protein
MFQRGDGHFGAYVVRQTPQDDPQSKLYDYDLTEHIIIAQEWFHAVKIVSILVSIQNDMLLMKVKSRQLYEVILNLRFLKLSLLSSTTFCVAL